LAKKPASPLSEFWRFAADFRSLTAWIATAVIAAPLADLALGIGPPWPSRTADAAFLTIVVGFVVMFAFEFWRKRSRRTGQRAFIVSLVIAALLFISYLCISAFFVADADDQGGKEIIGYTMHGDVQQMAEAEPSKWTPKELLLQFHDPMEVWTRNSVITMRVVLLLLWLAMWIAIAVGMAAFVSLQWIAADAAARKLQPMAK
jgi:hypothetical protein